MGMGVMGNLVVERNFCDLMLIQFKTNVPRGGIGVCLAYLG
jgi:hypothetical protein